MQNAWNSALKQIQSGSRQTNLAKSIVLLSCRWNTTLLPSPSFIFLSDRHVGTCSLMFHMKPLQFFPSLLFFFSLKFALISRAHEVKDWLGIDTSVVEREVRHYRTRCARKYSGNFHVLGPSSKLQNSEFGIVFSSLYVHKTKVF